MDLLFQILMISEMIAFIAFLVSSINLLFPKKRIKSNWILFFISGIMLFSGYLFILYTIGFGD